MASSTGSGSSSEDADTDGLRSMLMTFRISELSQLLDFAGKNKTGKKSELQVRALALLQENKKEVNNKIHELSSAMYKSIGGAASVNPYSANYNKNNGSKNSADDDDVTPPALPVSNAQTTKRAAAAKAAAKARKKKDDDSESEEDQDDDDDDFEDDFDDGASSDYTPSSSSASRTPSPEPVKIKRPPPTANRSMRNSTRELSKASLAAAAAAANPVTPKDKKKGGSKTSPQKSASTSRGGARGKKTTAAEAIASSAQRGKATTSAASKSKTSPPLTTTANSSGGTSSTTTTSSASSLTSSSLQKQIEEDSVPIYPQYHRNNSIVNQAYRAGYFASHGQSSTMRSGTATTSKSSSSTSSTTSTSTSTARNATTTQRAGLTPFQYENPRSNPSLLYPTFPDVKLRRLPFYRIMATLMQPCSLQPSGSARFQEQKFSFFLSPTQVENIERGMYRDSATGRFDHKSQIQLRFSLLETSCEQDDNFPSSICVKVNNKMQSLPNPIPTNKPGVEPKRPPKPINITPLCRMSATMPNYLDISWAVDYGRGYTVSVYFVEKLNSNDLMKQLKDRGTRHPDYTKATIKEKLNDKDSDVSTMSCKVTLACPLGKMRMTWPARSSTCDHLQCFDAALYLMMNERKPKWLCPVCNKMAFFDNLQIDGFFKEVLGSSRLPSDDHEIVLHNDGSWDPLPPKRDPNSTSSPSPPPSPKPQIKPDPGVETLSVDDDSSDTGSNSNNTGSGTIRRDATVKSDEDPRSSSMPGVGNATANPQKRSIDCITLDSDDEGSDDVPLSLTMKANKRARSALLDDDVDASKSDDHAASSSNGGASSEVGPSSAQRATVPAPAKSPQIICVDLDD